MKNNLNKNIFSRVRGFTLVELIIVVAIIGILAGIVYANFGDARASARDESRKVALKEMQLALEMYKAQNGRYPAACRGANSWSGGIGSFACSGGAPYVTGLAPDYIGELPFENSAPSGRGYIYRVDASGLSYKLMAHAVVEKNLVTGYDNEFARCPVSYNSNWCGSSPQSNSYAVYGGPSSPSW